MISYWMGVASQDHVERGVEGGFCQFCHGKSWPLERLKPGDRIIYYSPREQMNEGVAIQAFTAIGEVLVCSQNEGTEPVAEGAMVGIDWHRDAVRVIQEASHG